MSTVYERRKRKIKRGSQKWSLVLKVCTTINGYTSNSNESGKNKSDDYDVDDFYDAEDFYDWYYDAFYDYEEAEEYFDEYGWD